MFFISKFAIKTYPIFGILIIMAKKKQDNFLKKFKMRQNAIFDIKYINNIKKMISSIFYNAGSEHAGSR
jgi:hypothetical protein